VLEVEFVAEKLDVINLDKLLDVAVARTKGWASSRFDVVDNLICYRITTTSKTLLEFLKLIESYGKPLYIDVP